MGFVNHGGMWGDVLFLPLVAALMVPIVRASREVTPRLKFLVIVLSAAATLAVHWQWATVGRDLGTTDHVFPTHVSGAWFRDISVAGWLHVVYMTGFLGLVVLYAVLSVPPKIVWLTSAILTLHLLLGQLQPAWYSTGTIAAPNTIASVLTTVIAVWIVAVWKIRSARVRAGS